MERQAKDGTIYQMVGQDEWAPVTRSAKDGTVYKKVGDDQWSPMDQPKQDAKPQEQSIGEKIGRGALSAVDTATKVLDIPSALVRGSVGKVVGTKNQGLSPWSAPSSQEIVETMAPSTAKPVTVPNPGPGGLPIESFMTPDEQETAKAQSQLKPSVAIGAAADLGLGYGVSKGLSAAGRAISGPASSAAERLAVNSTGATGVQSSKFAPDAGRQLLDRGLVKFGDSAKNVAERVGAANEAAGTTIDETLKALDAKGVTASAENVVAELEKKASLLKKDPSQAGAARKIQGIIDDIKGTGESNVPISQGEQTKRGFNKAAGNWMDPEAGKAGKEAYQAYKNEVENAATAADPALAKKFTDSKETYGLLAPIQEAAERRANTLNQSPIGGLGDMAAAIAGAATGGPAGAAGGVIAKKVIAPRIASSAAVTLDSISKMLQASPEMSDLSKANPLAYNAVVKNIGDHLMQGPAALPAAASKDAQPKGRDKWASDGIDKLMKHSDDPAFIKQLSDKKDDPKVKDLLIKASDLKPGSKAMDDIMSKIKDRVSTGGQ